MSDFFQIVWAKESQYVLDAKMERPYQDRCQRKLRHTTKYWVAARLLLMLTDIREKCSKYSAFP